MITRLRLIPKSGHYKFNLTIEGGVTVIGCIYRPETGAIMPPMLQLGTVKRMPVRLNPSRIPTFRKFVERAIAALEAPEREEPGSLDDLWD